MDKNDITKLANGLAASSGRNVVPFGKYRGQPVEVMRADQGYWDWAYAQDGIRRQYPWIFNVNFGEPSHTPEHNRYQAMFLEQDFVADVWELLNTGLRKRVAESDRESILSYMKEATEREIREIEKEVYRYGNWAKDEVKLAEAELRLTKAKQDLVDVPQRKETLKASELKLAEVDVEFEAAAYEGHTFRGSADVQLSCCGKLLRIDIKPSMGDDYPAVLRQMKAADCNVLYLVQYDGTGATLDQVIRMFKASHIEVLEHQE